MSVKPRRRHQTGGADLLKDRGAQAKRLAAAILEVLAGARTPTDKSVVAGLRGRARHGQHCDGRGDSDDEHRSLACLPRFIFSSTGAGATVQPTRMPGERIFEKVPR